MLVHDEGELGKDLGEGEKAKVLPVGAADVVLAI